MPPKRRMKTNECGPCETVSTECQTDFYDEELERELQKIYALKKLPSTTTEKNVEQTGDNGVSEITSATISLPKPQLLYFQLKACTRIIAKLSAESQKAKSDNTRITSFFGEIFRLIRAMRSDYDSTLQITRDSVTAMSADMMRYVGDVRELLSKQKTAADEDRKRYKQKIKSKDVQIEHLQEKLKESNEHLATLVEALEAEQRRVSLCERDMHSCREKVREVNNKLSDQLFLGNQKCMSCQANEKVRDMLSDEVAEKTNTANVFHQKYLEMESQLVQQKRVNEILSRAVDKHSFAERAIRGEFERIKTEYNNLIGETRALRTQVKLDAAAAASTVTITPPDSDKSNSKDDSTKGSLPDIPEIGDAESPDRLFQFANNAHNLAKHMIKRTKLNSTNNLLPKSSPTQLTKASFTPEPCLEEKNDGKVSTPYSISCFADPVKNRLSSSCATTMSFTSLPATSANVDECSSFSFAATTTEESRVCTPDMFTEDIVDKDLMKTFDKDISPRSDVMLLDELDKSKSSTSLEKPSTKGIDALTNEESTTSSSTPNDKETINKANNASKPNNEIPAAASNFIDNRKRPLFINAKTMSVKQLKKNVAPLRPTLQTTVKLGNFFQSASQSVPVPLMRSPASSSILQRPQQRPHEHQQRAMEARRLAVLQEEVIRREQQQIMRERQMIQTRRETQQMELLWEQQRERFMMMNNGSGRQFGHTPPCDSFGRPRSTRLPESLMASRPGGALPWHGSNNSNSGRLPLPPMPPPATWMQQPSFSRRP